MEEPLGFKRGCDLAEVVDVVEIDDETVNCEACGRPYSSRGEAGDAGWQLDPPVSPDCLRWVADAVAADCCGLR